jgi:hypothetical protein
MSKGESTTLVKFDIDALRHCCGVDEVGGFNAVVVKKAAPFDSKRPWEWQGHTRRPPYWTDADSGNVAEYHANGEYDENPGGEEESDYSNPSGTGFFIATFVDDKDCKAAYERLTREHKLLYQSPPMVNRRSDNKVFVCVFLHSDVKLPRGLTDLPPPIRTGVIASNWPLARKGKDRLPA